MCIIRVHLRKTLCGRLFQVGLLAVTNRFRLLPSTWCRRFSRWQPSDLCQWPSLGWCHRCACHFSVCQAISSLDVLWVVFPSPSYSMCFLLYWVSSLRITCTYHDSRFLVRTDLIGVTLAIPLMVSFLILSFLVFPWLHLSNFISVVSKRCSSASSCLRSAQHSLPYHRRSDNCFVQLAF